jgi:hypothetical protein
MDRLGRTRARIRKEQEDRTEATATVTGSGRKRDIVSGEEDKGIVRPNPVFVTPNPVFVSFIVRGAERGIHIEASDREIVKIKLSIISPLSSFVCLSCFLSSLSLRRLV